MRSKQFYSMPTNTGMKLVNINNIALIEAIGTSTILTMNVNGKTGEPISFEAMLPWGSLSGEIMVMDTLENT